MFLISRALNGELRRRGLPLYIREDPTNLQFQVLVLEACLAVRQQRKRVNWRGDIIFQFLFVITEENVTHFLYVMWSPTFHQEL